MTSNPNSVRHEWRFLQLPLFIAGWMLVAPHLSGRRHVQVLLQALLLNSMIVTFWANPQWRHLRRAVVVFWLVSTAGAAVGVLPLPADWRQMAEFVERASSLPLLAALSAGILVFVFRNRELSADGVFATIAVYLLIAMLFAQLYLLLLAADPGCFSLPEAVASRPPRQLQNDMLYFSFVTLATVGYGDILPVGDSTRMLAMLEAVVGQFYVAVVVAVFVGMYSTQRRD
jgi:hypothetical protein